MSFGQLYDFLRQRGSRPAKVRRLGDPLYPGEELNESRPHLIDQCSFVGRVRGGLRSRQPEIDVGPLGLRAAKIGEITLFRGAAIAPPEKNIQVMSQFLDMLLELCRGAQTVDAPGEDRF